MTAEIRLSGRARKKLVAEFVESVYYRPVVARPVASGIQPKLYVGRYLGNHALTSNILIMTTDGVVIAVWARSVSVENRWNVDSWSALRGLPWDVTERGADAALKLSIILGRHIGAILLWQSAVQRVVTLLFMVRQQNLARLSVERGLASKWSTILRVTNVCKFTSADEMWNLRLKWTRHWSQERLRAIPHLC